MSPDEYDTYLSETHGQCEQTVNVAEVPGPDRTLVYGYSRAYDADMNESTYTVHVYKRDGLLHVVFYEGLTSNQVFAQSGESLPLEVCSPRKRAYPERCDLDFARLMRERDMALSFTTLGGAGSNSEGTFAGLFIEDTYVTAGA